MIADARADLAKGGEANKGTLEALHQGISDDMRRLAQDMHSFGEQSQRDNAGTQSKITRLATQFDAELAARDKQFNQLSQ